mmetsp:Transcript_44073/g.95868  ORF Transcript_44073/g.95868 Transcript_44073/m.95868 type:complete len:204 (-) Transcript_44073:125-736(-)
MAASVSDGTGMLRRPCWPAIHDHKVSLEAKIVGAHFAAPLVGQGSRIAPIPVPEIDVVRAQLPPILGFHVGAPPRTPVPPPAEFRNIVYSDTMVLQKTIQTVGVGVAAARNCKHSLAKHVHSIIKGAQVPQGVDITRLPHEGKWLLPGEDLIDVPQHRSRLIPRPPPFHNFLRRTADLGPLVLLNRVVPLGVRVDHKIHHTRS